MKTITLAISISAIALLAITNTEAQAGGGGGGGAAGGGTTGGAMSPAVPTTPTTPTTPVAPGQTTISGSAQTTTQPGTTGVTNNLTSTNRFGQNTNRFGTNGLSPTGAATGGEHHRDFDHRDHANTANDQALLIRLQATIRIQLGINTPSAELPINLLIDNGVVTLVGFVPTANDRQRILLQTQQSPGVVDVVDRMQVGTPPAPFSPAFQPSQVDHAFSPTDQRLLQAVRHSAAAQLGAQNTGNTLVAPKLPVHFSVENGVVSVMGTLVTTSQKQALLQALGRTPGVVRVVDAVQVGGASTVGVPQNGMTTNQ